MGKSKIKLFLLCTISVWLVITLFFFFHHRIVVKTVTIPGWELNQETGVNVKVKEVRLRNKQPVPAKFSKDFKITGITKIIIDSNLPNRIKIFYGKLISFYSLSYEQKWSLEVAGVYLNSNENGEEISTIDDDDVLNIDLILNGEKRSLGSSGIRSGLNSNVKFFIVEVSDINPNIESIKVNWKWKEEQGSETIETDFKSTMHNFFKRVPFLIDNFSPEKVASDVIWNYREGKINQAIADQINVNEKLSWVKAQDVYTTSTQNIDYFKVYNGYKDVFAVTQGVEFNPNYRGEIKLDGIQTFYLTEENGKWEIIDISSFKKI